MEIKISEVLRYAGTNESDTAATEKAREIIAEVLPKLHPRKVVARFNAADIAFKGKLVEKTLDGANEVVLFAATLGLESEQILKSYIAQDYFSGVICDAVLTAAIESFCDEIERETMAAKPRISCGYGDFDIRNQKEILRLLNAEKLLGIRLNDSFMMYPNKSVTALVAICEQIF